MLDQKPEPAPRRQIAGCVVALVAWLVPGAAHLWLGQTRKAVTFFVMLSGMFAVGLAFGGRPPRNSSRAAAMSRAASVSGRKLRNLNAKNR